MPSDGDLGTGYAYRRLAVQNRLPLPGGEAWTDGRHEPRPGEPPRSEKDGEYRAAFGGDDTPDLTPAQLAAAADLLDGLLADRLEHAYESGPLGAVLRQTHEPGDAADVFRALQIALFPRVYLDPDEWTKYPGVVPPTGPRWAGSLRVLAAAARIRAENEAAGVSRARVARDAAVERLVRGLAGKAVPG